MKRPTTIIGNWKMHKTVKDAKEFISQFAPHVKKSTAKVGLAIPFTALYAVSDLAKEAGILLGAQNVWEAAEGAFTGETSALMLKDVGTEFVLIGHSERRKYFHETNALLSRKIKISLEHGLTVVLCIGESQEEREENRTEKVLTKQLQECLFELSPKQASSIIIAYEPIWAIGTGKTASPEMAEDAHVICREFIAKKWGADISQQMQIIYGGSVTPETISALLQKPNIDGALVGGASLKPELFARIINP
ncbi:MAG: triose-phosphate isomerase [Chlamydiae bacterium]|nr:triose-phosphate isomerase [Chlamydiota bacterium]